jgi:hypothetical protein
VVGQIGTKSSFRATDKMILLDNTNLENKFATLLKSQQRKRLHKSKNRCTKYATNQQSQTG